jgi:ABC-2 type transport system permease protein
VNGTAGPVRNGRTIVGLIAGREIRTRLGGKAFRITLLVLVLMVIGMNIGLHVAQHNSGPSTSRIGLEQQDAALAGPLRAAGEAAGRPVVTSTVTGAADGRAQVRGGRLTAFVATTPAGRASPAPSPGPRPG